MLLHQNISKSTRNCFVVVPQLEKFKFVLDYKIKELTIAVERLNKTVFARQAELEREVTDTQAAQVQLDKAAADFARLHKVLLAKPALASLLKYAGAKCSSLRRRAVRVQTAQRGTASAGAGNCAAACRSDRS